MNAITTITEQLQHEIQALDKPNTASIRAIRRQYTHRLKQADPVFIFELANVLISVYAQHWLAYEFVRYHKTTFQRVDEAQLEALGQGINSWETVDAFARILAGPAWLKGYVSDDLIWRWARSDNLWWRRAALVSTVALNVRSQGGTGDVARTLAICRLLVDDTEDMVEKALSWALRELVVHDPEAVSTFLSEHEADLSARVKREVKNKLDTGLKSPKKSVDTKL
ncbi:MAG: DNA alkylation repair protein [Anaerolineae bacterium]|nr:DNA alkylation repair protein [Anaerolineae bacterium]